jgi:hypothetical protein
VSVGRGDLGVDPRSALRAEREVGRGEEWSDQSRSESAVAFAFMRTAQLGRWLLVTGSQVQVPGSRSSGAIGQARVGKIFRKHMAYSIRRGLVEEAL